jgi:secreted trypsin-like serine protease
MKDGRWYLAGLTSFGSGCAKPGFPDVFTRITAYHGWIHDVIRQREGLKIRNNL